MRRRSLLLAAAFSYPSVDHMHARELWDNRDGAVIPYLAMMLAVIIGLAALALDASRLMNLQTQLQNGADALALAGSAELDRRPDSIIRAEAAIRDLIANTVAGSGTDQRVKVESIDFLKSLPTSDDLSVTTADLTDDPTLAAYVQVTVAPVSLQTIFPVSLVSGRLNVALRAESVAGYDQIICNAVTPVYVCNPFETAGMTYYQATQALIAANEDTASQRRLIRLSGSQLNNNGAYGAGSIGYLAPSTGSFPAAACGPGSAYGVPQALATSGVRACFRLSAANLLSSDDGPAADALNTRFDIYANGFGACRIYAPDQNVRKGFVAIGNTQWCDAIPAGTNWPISAANATALPIDGNMVRANGTLDPTIDIGNGSWNCTVYWSEAHFSGPGKGSPPAGYTTAATITRYQVYTYEMNLLNDRSRGGEIGAPQCAPPGENNRRIVTAAIINCGSTPVPMRNDAQGVPIAAFGRFFLVLPANSRTNSNLYAEFLGLVKRSDPSSTDMVQLYR
jgi:Flp pilus assembly protein TadG